MYLFIFLSFLLFLYSINFYNSLTTSINFSPIYSCEYKRYNFYLFIASFAGVPPLLGFWSKWLFFNTILLNQQYIYLYLFIFINIFLTIFYLQQARYFQTNQKKIVYLRWKYKLNLYTYSIVLLLQFINIFSFFILPLIIKFIFLCLFL